MTWLMWRQRRVAGFISTAFLAALALLLSITGVELWNRFHEMTSCRGSGCAIVNEFGVLRGLDSTLLIVRLMVVVPLVIGVFWGATTIARDFEAGTHVLVWTQGITRRQWLAGQLATSMAAATIWGALLSGLVTWWLGPLNSLHGDRFAPGKFDGQGVVPLGYTLFAVALGLASGAVFRRVVPALATTVAGFTALRLMFTLFLRQHLMPARVVEVRPDRVDALSNGAWVFSSRLVLHGQSVAPPTVSSACSGDPGGCLSDAGYRVIVTYQPAGRFWAFQYIEAGIFAALACGLLIVTYLVVTRRDT